ncbi:hypothetical protein L7F22_060942 [Adiantum nelumboides]|nr:hypothetical protein [Adiantum nelumboides]
MAPWGDGHHGPLGLAPLRRYQADCAVLNVGFGLGIIDELFQARNPPPARHVIIEAHPDAIAHAKQLGWDKRPGVELIHAKWEDALESLEGDFDAVYWDTYAQGYGELRSFFEHLPNLLSGPRQSFPFVIHGLAGTNPFLYDVYTRVAELDLKDIGLVTDWHTLRPTTTQETWQGVVRKYWQLDTINVPRLQDGPVAVPMKNLDGSTDVFHSCASVYVLSMSFFGHGSCRSNGSSKEKCVRYRTVQGSNNNNNNNNPLFPLSLYLASFLFPPRASLNEKIESATQ